MTLKHFKTLGTGSVADGDTFEKTYTSKQAEVIEKIYIQDKNDNALFDLDLTIRIAGKPITREKVSGDVFQQDWPDLPEIMKDLPESEDFYISGDNGVGAAIDLYITLRIGEV